MVLLNPQVKCPISFFQNFRRLNRLKLIRTKKHCWATSPCSWVWTSRSDSKGFHKINAIDAAEDLLTLKPLLLLYQILQFVRIEPVLIRNLYRIYFLFPPLVLLCRHISIFNRYLPHLLLIFIILLSLEHCYYFFNQWTSHLSHRTLLSQLYLT
jgi:hypothetical protein